MPEFDNEASLREAYQRLPLEKFLTEHGVGPKNPGEKWKAFECPFCHKKKKAGIFRAPDGATMLLKCQVTSCVINKAINPIGYLELTAGLSRSEAFQAFLKQAGVWKDPEPKAPVDKTPPPPEKKPEPPKVEEPPALPLPLETPAPKPSIPDNVIPLNGEDESMIQQCIEIIRSEQSASTNLLQRRLRLGFTRATRIMDELERRGIVGPARDRVPREILKLPANPGVEPSEPQGAEAGKGKKPPEAEDAPMGQLAMEDFYAALQKTDSSVVTYLPGAKIPSPLPGDTAKQLKFKKVSLLEKRGLSTSTCLAMGFAANPMTNREILFDLSKKYPMDELEASGLWLPEDKKKKQPARPNKQFYGLGQIGKKPQSERKNKDDKWQWGNVCPVIIPYFDETGRLLKLRPHKGGAPSNTLCGMSRIYVPRDPKRCMDTSEVFYTVVICEGEFKAVALWQTLGAGRDDGRPPIGVCAIPGINFGKDFSLREELDAWLQSVFARTVIVAFDDQDKSDKPLRERHEAMIWSQYLAADLQRKLHITGKVCVLPKEWRDASGKSDWDGALAKFVNEPITAAPSQ